MRSFLLVSVTLLAVISPLLPIQSGGPSAQRNKDQQALAKGRPQVVPIRDSAAQQGPGSQQNEHGNDTNGQIYTVKVVSEPTNGWYVAYVLATAAAVVISLFALCAVWKQVGIMRGQLEQLTTASAQTGDLVNQTIAQTGALQNAAVAAKSSADAALLNAQAFINSERAWLFPQVIKNQQGQFTSHYMIIKNYGKTPAELISIKHGWVLLDRGQELPEKLEYGPPGEFEHVIVLVPGGQHHAEDVDLSYDNWFQKDRRIDHGGRVIWIFGVIEYRDVLPGSESHETRFCFRYYRQLVDWRSAGPHEYTKYS